MIDPYEELKNAYENMNEGDLKGLYDIYIEFGTLDESNNK